MTDDDKKARAAGRRRIRAWYADLFAEIPEGMTPLEAAITVKCIDAAGSVCLINTKTSGLTTWEALGMLISAGDDMRAALNSYEDND